MKNKVTKKTDSKGMTRWFFCGILHRDNGPALISIDGKSYSFFKHGLLHRVGGPAEVHPNYYSFCQNDVEHRIDGPAIFFLEDKKIIQKIWFIRGEDIQLADELL